MAIKLQINTPSNDMGFVENKRSFVVNGSIITDSIIPDDCLLLINILDINDNIVRHVYCDKKNKAIYMNLSSLTLYPEDMDADKTQLLAFGFPELIVDDIDNYEESIKNATIKCWYSDNEFKAVITNGSDTKHGCIFNDGMNYLDENNNPYSVLDKGEYKIEVLLKHHEIVLAKSYKDFVIGNRENQLICRFNPISHKNRMIKFSKENNYSIITDLLPGYLEPYLGTWLYHMGLLQMYRANDICLFEDVHVRMFDYLIDETSTSYSTEIAYLENNKLIKADRFSVYYYDIGEAKVGDKQAKILEFSDTEYGAFCRVDEIIDDNCENVFNLNEKNIINSNFELDNVVINNKYIAVMGVVKPIQLDPNDFILKDDNTYEILDYPDKIEYQFKYNNKVITIYRDLNMERIDGISIGKSVYEFYNVFDVSDIDYLEINAKCIYIKGKTVDIKNHIIINNGRTKN